MTQGSYCEQRLSYLSNSVQFSLEWHSAGGQPLPPTVKDVDRRDFYLVLCFLFLFCPFTPQGKTNFTPQCHWATLRCKKRSVFLLLPSQQMALMGIFLHVIPILEMIQMVQMGTSSGKILLVTQSPAQPWTPVWSWLHPSITYKWGLTHSRGWVCP